MKKIITILTAIILSFVICFGAVSTTVEAATKAETQQKKNAKTFDKWLKKVFKSNDVWGYKIKYKKTGSRYTFTITCTSKQMPSSYIRDAAFIGGDNYGDMLKMFCKLSKTHYKNAKKAGLKKPIVRMVWKTSDGFTVATFKNGTMEDD
jgi:uncharacterized protein YxeA